MRVLISIPISAIVRAVQGLFARRAPPAPQPVPPVDRTQRTLTDNVPEGADPTELKPNGQQRAYVVLSADERAKGFVRPVRHTYSHVGRGAVWNGSVLVSYGVTSVASRPRCGVATTMSDALAETYARDPYFYSGTFCVGCGKHLPLEEFAWDDGTTVGS